MRADAAVDIAVFARAPIAGQAKTRLIPRLGAAGAARLQQQLIASALARAAGVPGARVALWATRDDATMQAAARAAGAALRVQAGADLGARMAHAFAATLDGARPMLLIGTDCPAQTAADLRQAVAALATADAVLQPAEDGGYVMIGMRTFHPALFEDVAWGTSTVLAATRARAAAHGLGLAELPPSWDLDRGEDLDRALALGLVRLPAR
jgi:hypothetical protein